MSKQLESNPLITVAPKNLLFSGNKSDICANEVDILLWKNPYKKNPMHFSSVLLPNKVIYELKIYTGMTIFIVPFLPYFSGMKNRMTPKTYPMKYQDPIEL